MTIKKPVIAKPESKPSRFAAAKAFAKSSDEKPTVQAEPEALDESVADQETVNAAPLKKAKNDAPTVRENFDVEEPLRKEMRLFIANSRKFRSKRQFLTQCLKDGLEKYKGQ